MPKNLNLTDNLEQYIINHSDDLTEANDKAHAVAESGAVVTITTVVQAVDGEWEDTSDDNLVLRYLYATPNDISYWGS